LIQFSFLSRESAQPIASSNTVFSKRKRERGEEEKREREREGEKECVLVRVCVFEQN